ncbi:hypothetical protein BDV95DRAFT_484629, partial [Massariosphaeria phaeospora]
EECTTKQEFPTCTTQFFIVTSVFPDQDSSTTSTSTSTNCHTITACTGVATTIATTTARATTIESFCERGKCGGNACSAKPKRAALPTPAPIIGGLTISDETSEEQNATLVQRAFTGGTGDWGDFYNDVIGRTAEQIEDNDNWTVRKETILVDNDVEFIPGRSAAVHFQAWGVEPRNVVIQDLYGCAALFCVSHLGVAVAHFWEKPSLTERLEEEVIELLGHKFALYNFGHDPVCHLMAGARKVIGGNGAEEQETLTQPWKGDIMRPEAIQKIREKVKTILPDATMKDAFVYARQVNAKARERGYGKGAVVFEPNKDTGNAVVKVYNQGVEVEKMEWVNQELQIWRMNADGPSGAIANVVLQTDRDNVLDACKDVKTPVNSNMAVRLGSESTSVGEALSEGGNPYDMSFSIRDKNNNKVVEKCVFKGGPYGRWQDGAQAGVLECKGRTIRCTRPQGDAPGKSCDPANPPDCGKLGEKCSKGYNELLAICKN